MAQRDLTLNIGANTKELNAALGKMRKDVRAATGNVQNMMKEAGTQMTAALTLPLVAFGANSIKTFASFEQSMAKVKAVSGATAGEFEDLNARAKELGATTRFTSSQVAGLMLEYSKLGFSSDEIQKVTGSTLALAQATDSDLSQAAMVAGSTLRGFGLEADQTGRMVDVMAAAFSGSALDIDAFQGSMKFVAPVANAAGVSLENSTAMLSALANAGIKGSQAGTALRRIFTEMADTGLPAAEAIKRLAEEGIELADAKDEVGRNAMSALLVLTKSIPQIEELTKQYENSEGAAKGMAAIMDDTTEGAFKKMASAVEAVSISFGESFAPAAQFVAKIVAGLANVFSSLPGPLRNLLGVLGLLTAAAGPLLLLGPQLIAAAQALAVFKSQLMATRAAALLMSPMGPVVAVAITAVAFAAYVASKRLGGMKDQLSATQKLMKSAAATHDTEAAKVQKLAELYEEAEHGSILRKVALQDLQKLAPDYFGNLDTEKSKLEDVKKALEAYNAEARNAAIQRVFGEQMVQITQNAAEVEMRLRKAGLEVEGFRAGFKGIFGGIDTIPDNILQAFEDGPAALIGVRDQMAALGLDEFILSDISALQQMGEETAELEAEMRGLADRMGTATTTTEAASSGTLKAASAQERLNEALKAAKKLGLDPDDLNIGGLLSKLGEGADDGSMTVFASQFRLSDEQIAEADASTQKAVDNAKRRLENFQSSVQSFGMSLAGGIQSVFSQLQEGSKTFGQIMGDILKQLLIKLVSMVAAFAILTVLTGGAVGSLGGFMKAGFGLPTGAVPMADGGIVSGPSHILAGEYPGAKSNPEVIAPLSKLKGMMGGGHLSARVSGRDLLFTENRDSRHARRQYTSTLV
jgi:hypothetical protein